MDVNAGPANTRDRRPRRVRRFRFAVHRAHSLYKGGSEYLPGAGGKALEANIGPAFHYGRLDGGGPAGMAETMGRDEISDGGRHRHSRYASPWGSLEYFANF